MISRGYLRDDGLWDIEGEIVDEKTYASTVRERGALPARTPYHDMCVRVTIDDDMTIRAIEASMPAKPFNYCAGVIEPLQRLVGLSLARGFRRKLGEAIGGEQGCTHLRDLILAVATTAHQTIFSYRAEFEPERADAMEHGDTPPFFINGCHTWDEKSPVVAIYYPKFHRKP
ncbi:DUF2889 domain-containing protein [Paraburkholderia sp.]|uniref:DUF2889 domain-containing protein n=1 Tax=Paraburkholderia sp. TaxID=1926495 RepID=UPI0039E634F4